MAKDDRIEIQWATFSCDVRFASNSSPARAVMRNEAVRLSLGTVGGLPFLIIEDRALPIPATVPWHNVASVGWVALPTIGSAPK
jgi:hypothetical protein